MKNVDAVTVLNGKEVKGYCRRMSRKDLSVLYDRFLCDSFERRERTCTKYGGSYK